MHTWLKGIVPSRVPTGFNLKICLLAFLGHAMCNFCLIDQKMELSKKRNPQNGRKKSAKRTQKTANKRNLKKRSNFLLMCQ